MDTDSFYLEMSGDSLEEIAKPEMKQTYEDSRKIGSQRTNLAREHPAYLSLTCRRKRRVGYCKVLPCSK